LFQAHIYVLACLLKKNCLKQQKKKKIIISFVLYVFRVYVLNCYAYLRVWSDFRVRFCWCRSSVLTIVVYIVDNVIIMLENCSSHRNCNCGKRSASVIGKLAKVFGCRKTYQVQKAQQLNKVSSAEPGEVYLQLRIYCKWYLYTYTIRLYVLRTYIILYIIFFIL